MLSLVLARAVDEGKLATNPAAEIRRRPVAKRETYIEPDHFVAITSRLEEWQARACDLLYLVSHNPQDVLGLVDADITDVVPVRRRKTGAAVDIELDGDLAETVAWFRAWKREQRLTSPLLVCHPRSARRTLIGQRVSVEYLSRRWAVACRDAGFSYQLRDIRAQALTDEFLGGADGTKGGHKTEVMREHYRRVKLPLRARNTLRRLR